MRKIQVSALVALVLFLTNPQERDHYDTLMGEASFLGDFGVLLSSSAVEFNDFFLFSLTYSKRSVEMKTFGILGHVFRL